MNRLPRLIRWPRLTAAIVFCHTKTNEYDNKKVQQNQVVIELKQIAEQLTDKYLLQQTCTLAVNSSCQIITIALVSFSNASQNYKDELNKIIDMLEDKEWSDDELDNVLMEFRNIIVDTKTFYLDSISVMDSALQLGQSTVQMCFTVEANTVLNSMSEKLYSAEKEFQSHMEEIKKIEDKFTNLLADLIKN